MDEVKERLEEEERQCQVSLKNLWDECESCLESTCMRYYTTCKHGLPTFRRKVGRNFCIWEILLYSPKNFRESTSYFLSTQICQLYQVTKINLIWGVWKCEVIWQRLHVIIFIELWAKMSSVAPWCDSMATDYCPDSNAVTPDTECCLLQ